MIIRFLRPLLRSLSRRYRSCSRFRHRTLARLMAEVAGGTMVMGRKVCFDVPVRVDGQGSVIFEEHVSIGTTLAARLGSGEVILQARAPGSEIRIGQGTFTNNNVAVYSCARVEIGCDCLIGEFVAIYDSDFHDINPALRRTSTGSTQPVRIGDRVWLGSRVMVMKGVEIGDDAVIAAGAVVTKSIPPGVLAGGVPARVIRSIVEETSAAVPIKTADSEE